MELQILFGVCAKVSTKSILWREESGDRKDTKTAMRMEGSKHNRGRDVPRPCAYAGGNTAKDSSIELYGVFKGKKQYNAVRAIRRVEVQISKSRILVQGVLRGYGRKEYEPNCGIHSEPTKGRSANRAVNVTN